jgi:hypothetical protein
VILSAARNDLFAGLVGALPWLSLGRVVDGHVEVTHGQQRSLVVEDGEGGWSLCADDGVVAMLTEMPDGDVVVAAFPKDRQEQAEALLRPLLGALRDRAMAEQDIESMSYSGAQLLEQSTTLGETLPQLSAAATEEEIASLGLTRCLLAASVERAVYLRYHERLGRCEVVACAVRGADGSPELCDYEFDLVVPADQGMCREVLADFDHFALRQCGERDGQAPEGDLERLARREVMGVAVTSMQDGRRAPLGVLLLMDKAKSYELLDGRLGSEEGQVALGFASMIGAVLGARRSAALGKELSMAHTIQAQILPADAPDVPGFELAADYRTSGEVGGDYFDYVPMADGRTLVAVADVSGHNLASGMVMVGARATLRTLAAVCDDAGRLMTDLGATMYADLTSTERFITAVGVALRPGEGTVEVVNAGHNEVLWYRAESGLVESLSVEGTVLGFLPGVVYGTQTLQMQAGDCLFLYTDGVTEAQDDSGEMFGEERLVEVVRHACRKGAADVVASVMTAVERYQSDHELGDDITLVAIKATGPQERT